MLRFIAVNKMLKLKNLAVRSSLKGRAKLDGPANISKLINPASLTLYFR